MLPSLCEAISALSALSAGHYYLMRIVVYCPDFYCPAEIKEIAEIIVTDPREVLSAISVGHYYLMQIVFYCPDFYCPAEIKEIAEIIVTDPREVRSALSAGHYYLMRIVFISHSLCRFARRRKKGNSRKDTVL